MKERKVYDPRSDSMVAPENPVLVMADIISKAGQDLDDDFWPQVAKLADHCDKKVAYNYHGFTHHVPAWLLPLWKRICCRLDWHAWDEVWCIDRHTLYCDACGIEINIGEVINA